MYGADSSMLKFWTGKIMEAKYSGAWACCRKSRITSAMKDKYGKWFSSELQDNSFRRVDTDINFVETIFLFQSKSSYVSF